MKTISYYKAYPQSESPNSRRRYWHNAVADDLMRMFGDDHTLVTRQPGKNSHDTGFHAAIEGHFAIAYLELFDLPQRRPADFVWASIGDFLGLEAETELWLRIAEPNLLVTRQYYGDRLKQMCKKYGCKLILMPQFIPEPEVYHCDKKWTAMITGFCGPAYKLRTLAAQAMTGMNSDQVIVAMTGSHKSYPLAEDDYRDKLRHTKFVVSTGIWDLQMPPKHLEICNAGACLVSPVLPWMSWVGFEPNVHYIPIRPPIEAGVAALQDELLNSIFLRDDWETIAKAGQAMVQRRHTIHAWYNMLMREYANWKGCN